MKYLFIISFVLLSCVSFSQMNIKYSGSIEAGVTNGNQETNAFVNTIHGVKTKSWFAGIGAGIDYYRFRTVPVFFLVRKEITNKNVRPFIEAAAGINVKWLTDEQKVQRSSWWQAIESTYSNGKYFRAGGGVVFNANKQVRFASNLSWSYKSITEKYSERLWEPWPQPGNSLTEKTLLYKLNRINLGFSVMF